MKNITRLFNELDALTDAGESIGAWRILTQDVEPEAISQLDTMLKTAQFKSFTRAICKTMETCEHIPANKTLAKHMARVVVTMFSVKEFEEHLLYLYQHVRKIEDLRQARFRHMWKFLMLYARDACVIYKSNGEFA